MLSTGYSRREALHVGLEKYDTWFVRNVTASERQWADNITMTEGRGQEADLITLGPIFIREEVVGFGNMTYKITHAGRKLIVEHR